MPMTYRELKEKIEALPEDYLNEQVLFLNDTGFIECPDEIFINETTKEIYIWDKKQHDVISKIRL